jgi:hypothetical protein
MERARGTKKKNVIHPITIPMVIHVVFAVRVSLPHRGEQDMNIDRIVLSGRKRPKR